MTKLTSSSLWRLCHALRVGRHFGGAPVRWAGNAGGAEPLRTPAAPSDSAGIAAGRTLQVSALVAWLAALAVWGVYLGELPPAERAVLAHRLTGKRAAIGRQLIGDRDAMNQRLGRFLKTGRLLLVPQKIHVAKIDSPANDGSCGEGPGVGSGHPCATIQYAYDKAVASDSVIVHAGTYLEQVILDHGGTAGLSNRIFLAPASGDAVTINGTAFLNVKHSDNTAVTSANRTVRVTNGADRIVIAGFKVDGGIEANAKNFNNMNPGNGCNPGSDPQECYDAARDNAPDIGGPTYNQPGFWSRDPTAALGRWAWFNAGCQDAAGSHHCGSGLNVDPSDSLLITNNEVIGRGIQMNGTNFGRVTKNVIHDTKTGTGPGIIVTNSGILNVADSNYVHHTESDSASQKHFMGEGIRISRGAGYGSIRYNLIEHTSSGTPNPLANPPNCPGRSSTAGCPARGITGDVFASWNDYEFNTVRDADVNFSQQAQNRGQVHRNNLSDASRHWNYAENGTGDRTKTFATEQQRDVSGTIFAGQWTCNVSINPHAGDEDTAINFAAGGTYSRNRWTDVIVGKSTWEGSNSTNPATKALWGGSYGGTNGFPAGTFNASKSIYTLDAGAGSVVRADTLAWKNNCGCAGTNQWGATQYCPTVVAPPPPPPPPGGPSARADLWLTFTTKNGTVHPDSSGNNYHMPEAAGPIPLNSDSLMYDSTMSTMGNFGAIGSSDVWLSTPKSAIPKVAAYGDSMTALVVIDPAGTVGVDVSGTETILARWHSTNTLAQAWRLHHIRSSERYQFQYMDATQTPRTCLTDNDQISNRNLEAIAVTFANQDSGRVHLYGWRRGDTTARFDKYCAFAPAPIDTSKSAALTIGRLENAVNVFKGRIGNVYLSGYVLSKAALDSAVVRGIDRIQPAAVSNTAPNKPTVTAFAGSGGDTQPRKMQATISAFVDGDSPATPEGQWNDTRWVFINVNGALVDTVYNVPRTDAQTTLEIGSVFTEGGYYAASAVYSDKAGASSTPADTLMARLAVGRPTKPQVTQVAPGMVHVVTTQQTKRTDATISIQESTDGATWAEVGTALAIDRSGLSSGFIFYRAKARTPPITCCPADSSTASDSTAVNIVSPAPTDSLRLALFMENGAFGADSSKTPAVGNNGTGLNVAKAEGKSLGMRLAGSALFRPALPAYIRFQDATVLQSTKRLTVGALVKRPAGYIPKIGLIIGQPNAFSLEIDNQHRPQLRLGGSLGGKTLLGNAFNPGTTPYYVTAVFDSVQTRFYTCTIGAAATINATVAGSVGLMTDPADSLFVGMRRNWTTGTFDEAFDGYLDDVFYFKDRALGTDEIQQICDNGLAVYVRGFVPNRPPSTPTSLGANAISSLGATLSLGSYYDFDGDVLGRSCFRVYTSTESPDVVNACLSGTTIFSFANGDPLTKYYWTSYFEDELGLAGLPMEPDSFTTLATPPSPGVSVEFNYDLGKTRFFLRDRPESVTVPPGESREWIFDFSEEMAGTETIDFNRSTVQVVNTAGADVTVAVLTAKSLRSGAAIEADLFFSGLSEGLYRVNVEGVTDTGRHLDLPLYVQLRSTWAPPHIQKDKDDELKYSVSFGAGFSAGETISTVTLSAIDAAGLPLTSCCVTRVSNDGGGRVSFWVEQAEEPTSWTMQLSIATSLGKHRSWLAQIDQQ